MVARFPFAFAVCVLAASPGAAEDLPWLQVSADGRGFIQAQSREPFIPWGFNYDHDGDGQLIEDYWDEQWDAVESAFAEMKALGANVVRIHLQFGKFMEDPATPNRHSLEQLARLTTLAEKTGIYLDLTGLGCYHKQDVPAWYDALAEQDRWDAQAAFWEAVAKTCADSSAIFCYDLMNEPVVPGGTKRRDDWLGGAFAGKHFVQFIALETKGRQRHEIAQKWIGKLVSAIRKHDQRHLVTVGLVPWSLERPGLTSGFVPERIAGDLDFISVHVYPEAGKVDEAIETVKGFGAAGKPVLIEEMFPLKCGADELSRFIDRSRPHAAGWIGFYWGTTPEEYRSAKAKGAGTIGDALTLSWLELFEKKTPQIFSPVHAVSCEGHYQRHLQGIAVEPHAIYWSFTTELVKTDLNGRVLKKIPVADHHGDLCFDAGRLYVAVNLGEFNDPQGNADSWVYVYDAVDLSLLAKHPTPQVFHGAGGIGIHNDSFFVVGGLPDAVDENYVYEYDRSFGFIQKHIIESGHTHLGIQTATFAGDRWFFGCYGEPKILLVTDAEFQMQGRFELDCSLGVVGLPDGRMLVASGRCVQDLGCSGRVDIAVADDEVGLEILGSRER